MNVQINIDTASCIRCGKMRQGLPCLDHDAGQTRRPDRSAQYRLLHRLRTLRGRLPDRLGPPQFISPDKIHPIDRNGLPSPEQVLLLCKARRSNRALSDRPVPQEAIDRILEAAHRAPTASNRQEVSFTVITDPAILDKIIRFTLDTFAESPANGKPARQTHTQTSAA